MSRLSFSLIRNKNLTVSRLKGLPTPQSTQSIARCLVLDSFAIFHVYRAAASCKFPLFYFALLYPNPNQCREPQHSSPTQQPNSPKRNESNTYLHSPQQFQSHQLHPTVASAPTLWSVVDSQLSIRSLAQLLESIPEIRFTMLRVPIYKKDMPNSNPAKHLATKSSQTILSNTKHLISSRLIAPYPIFSRFPGSSIHQFLRSLQSWLKHSLMKKKALHGTTHKVPPDQNNPISFQVTNHTLSQSKSKSTRTEPAARQIESHTILPAFSSLSSPCLSDTGQQGR